MMAYVDILIGALIAIGWLYVVSSRLWHHFLHDSQNGLIFKGRLWCGYCARREQNVTRDQWREEALTKIRRLL